MKLAIDKDHSVRGRRMTVGDRSEGVNQIKLLDKSQSVGTLGRVAMKTFRRFWEGSVKDLSLRGRAGMLGTGSMIL